MVHFWCIFLRREGFASELRSRIVRGLAEIRAPVRGLRRPCVFSKKEKKEPLLVPSSFLRRERDSNPRSLSAQRFSRPPQSTTLPSLLRRSYKLLRCFLGWFSKIGCKSTAFLRHDQIFFYFFFFFCKILPFAIHLFLFICKYNKKNIPLSHN